MYEKPKQNSNQPETIADADGFVERMKALFQDSETFQNRIDSLVMQGEQGKEELGKLVEDLAKMSLKDDESFMYNASKIRSRRYSQSETAEMVQQQKDALENRKRSIAELADIPDEALETDIEKAKQHVLEIIDKDDSPHDALEKLGILTQDDNGKDVFTYPEEIMPESTNDKWDVYLATVVKHVKLDKDVRKGVSSQSELEDADSVRRFAHNRVARDLHQILELDKLSDDKWDFEKTRNLLAKMRDARFPTMETSESLLTGEAILDALGAAKALSSRVSELRNK